MIGVYQIECNGKRYVGSSVNIEQRWRQHLYGLRKCKHPNQHLQNSFNKHGELALVFSVLEIIERSGDLIKREQKYIDLLRPEYNIRLLADSNLGVRRSEESKRKYRESTNTKEYKQRWRDSYEQYQKKRKALLKSNAIRLLREWGRLGPEAV